MPGHVPHTTPAVTDPGAYLMCQDGALMDSIRILMMLGLILVIGLLLYELHVYNAELAKKQSKPTKNQDTGVCPIHKGDPDTCRDSHSSDSPSQEPPTDDSEATSGRGESAAPSENKD